MTGFAIIGILTVVWIIYTVISQRRPPVPQTMHQIRQQTVLINNGAKKESLFEVLIQSSNVMARHFNNENRKNAFVEILLLHAAYTSIYCNTYCSNVSDRIDEDLRHNLSLAIRNNGSVAIINNQFHSIDGYMRSRLLMASNDLQKIDFLSDAEYRLDYPLNIYNAIALSPCLNFKEFEDGKSPNNEQEVLRFEKVVKGMLISLTQLLREQLPLFYPVPKNSTDLNLEKMHWIKFGLDFTYYPLYQDFCVMCGTHNKRSDMVDVDQYDFDEDFGSIHIKRMCKSCRKKRLLDLMIDA